MKNTIETTIELSYLGDRNYIDISSVLAAVWNTYGKSKRNEITKLEFRLVMPITESCNLLVSKCPIDNASGNRTVFGEMTWNYKGDKMFGLLVGNGGVVKDRRPEVDWNFDDHCDVEGDKVFLRKTFSNETGYNYMKMGKYFLSKFMNPNVKFCKFYFDYYLPAAEMVGVYMTYSLAKGGNFLILNCFHNDEKYGYIMAKIIS